MTTAAKRKYNRRSDNERIEALESKIDELRSKIESRKRKDSPVLKEIPKIQRMLSKFAQRSLDHGRADIANTTTAFVAGLEHIYQTGMSSSASTPAPAETA